jgi:peptidyl-prolyl cis-trans isomerase C
MLMAKRAPALIGLFLAFALAACGLGRDNGGEGEGIDNPIVAATVNGRPIYVEDVRAYAVVRGWLEETEDLDANSDAFYMALEELIQIRLFSMEAEARGLDRRADIRRQLENARERVLANAIYDEIDQQANDQERIEALYRANAAELGEGEEVRLRHIQFDSREAADNARRRLDQGERFEALAFELSTERETAPDGGDLGFAALEDLSNSLREAVNRASVGSLIGPIELPSGWHILRLEDRRVRGAPSLESLRPRIIDWLRYQEILQLDERLSRDARIERRRQAEGEAGEGGEATAPPDAPDEPTPVRPAPSPEAPGAAPFPFPVGPGGIVGGPDNAAAPSEPEPDPATP